MKDKSIGLAGVWTTKTCIVLIAWLEPQRYSKYSQRPPIQNSPTPCPATKGGQTKFATESYDLSHALVDKDSGTEQTQ
jgi:hypothetical protein